MNSHLCYFEETCSTCLVAHIMAGWLLGQALIVRTYPQFIIHHCHFRSVKCTMKFLYIRLLIFFFYFSFLSLRRCVGGQKNSIAITCLK
ncbi:uncharacterized protein B0T23DRAFT_113354 [Neurospora hispaniola]|uniref:Uncharacterized protein n=1 Tax=Neurospora hispaniola TaxID=588809 RepID=A0AAJ0MSS5_9PEZI|nr:hypothetical protein B0T23DRAFT_113354 [Neurospora hispaniola]